MGSLCDYWKTFMPLDRLQINEHVAFKKHFNKERHLYGLPILVRATPSPAGSRNVSRNVSMQPNDISIEEDDEDIDYHPYDKDDADAGAGAD